MNLREMLREWPTPRIVDLGRPSLIETVQYLEARHSSAPKPPSQYDLDALKGRLLAAAQAGDWTGVSFRDLSRAAWVLWYGEPNIAAHDGFLDHYLTEMRQARRAAPIKRLIHVYLRDFDYGLPQLHLIAHFLALAVKNRDHPTLLPWQQRHQRCKLFIPGNGPDELADRVFEDDRPAHLTLSNFGLSGELQTSGFVRATLKCALERLRFHWRSSIAEPAYLDRLLEWAMPGGAPQPASKVDLINALLLPWADGDRQPEPGLRDKLMNWLVQRFKDPRLFPGHWQGVPDDAMVVMRRWLTGATLDQFFDLLSQTAMDHHWRYRRAFWTAYHRQDVITDAWLALGPRAKKRAREAFPDGYAAADLLRGYGVERDHSVLLMRIGGLTIAEWSHNGRCRVWLRNNTTAPTLYIKGYSRADVTQSSNTIDEGTPGLAHHGSDNYRWQQRLEAFIRKHTGIGVRMMEYKL